MSFPLALLLGMCVARAETLRQAFPPPPDTERASTDPFGAWLGELELAPRSTPVLTYDGRVVRHRARVVLLPLVKGDLQQCADSAIRLRAEWQRELDGHISFFATSGDPISWTRWQQGARPYVLGRGLAWRSGAGQTGESEQSWEAYLSAVFTWAGTLSLEAHETRPVTTPRAGDVLVQGGSPGHAVVILDVARGRTDDRTWLLIGEGYMPAQDFHIELGPAGGWWPWTEDGLDLPHWPMGPESLRRWK